MYANVEPSSTAAHQADIERHMLHMIYQYTRPHDAEDALNRTIDYSGKAFVTQKARGVDFFDNGVINAQEVKISKMKRKLN